MNFVSTILQTLKYEWLSIISVGISQWDIGRDTQDKGAKQWNEATSRTNNWVSID